MAIISAAAGGALTGTAGLPFMPEGTPWYGCLALYALRIGLPALLTYIAQEPAATTPPQAALIYRGPVLYRGSCLLGQGIGQRRDNRRESSRMEMGTEPQYPGDSVRLCRLSHRMGRNTSRTPTSLFLLLGIMTISARNWARHSLHRNFARVQG